MEKTWTWTTTGYSFVDKSHDEISQICRHAGRSGAEAAHEVFPSETDAEAEHIMRAAYPAWYQHFVQLWIEHGADPVISRYSADFDETVERDLLIFGSPAKVREEIERYVETSATNYFVCRFAYGSLTYDQSRAALDLFTEEVMPHFR